MASRPLHPLARQAVIASAHPAIHDWASGMTKYLVHVEPRGCVQWAFDVVRPYLKDTGEHGDVVTRSIHFLRDVLNDPLGADLKQMEDFAWDPWNHRSATCGGGPLARLIWAAMGVVELVLPGQAVGLSDSRLFPAEENGAQAADGLVWGQSAMAIQMIAYDHPELPKNAAEAFTRAVCFSARPLDCTAISRVEWDWSGVVYDIITLRTPDAFYFEFSDFAAEGSLFSGPFPSLQEVDRRMELLRHGPKTLRIIPRTST